MPSRWHRWGESFLGLLDRLINNAFCALACGVPFLRLALTSAMVLVPHHQVNRLPRELRTTEAAQGCVFASRAGMLMLHRSILPAGFR